MKLSQAQSVSWWATDVAMSHHGVAVMAMNQIQFQHGMSLYEFMDIYGSEAQCAAALAGRLQVPALRLRRFLPRPA